MVSHHAPQLHLHLLGPPEVRLDDELLVFATRKTLALLVYLALEEGAQPREHLATLLWPESRPERSYASLRNTLSHLHTSLSRASGPTQTPYITATHKTLALNPDANTDLDLHAVQRAYFQARNDRASRVPPVRLVSLPLLQSAITYHRGNFLTGFSLGNAPDFDDWVATQGEIWRRRLGLIFDRLSEIQYAKGDFAGAAETTSRWISLDALNEVAYRRKMRAHFAAGERGQALETYRVCRVVLADELNVEPEADTQTLAERIRTQHPSPPLTLQSNTPVSYLENLFAGRVTEHQALEEHYGHAAIGEPQNVILRGEAGIGKTRLAKEFLAWGHMQGAEVLQGGAFESGNHMLFQPVVEALRLWLDQENDPKDLLGDMWLSQLSQLLPELRDRLPELPSTHLGTEANQTNLFESFVRLTLALSRRAPLVLFLDDVQWADSATLSLLQYATRRWRETTAHIMLLVSLRSEALRPVIQPAQVNLIEWLGRVGRELTSHHIELELLSERDTIEMVLSVMVPPAADFAEWVFSETRGQPFYLIETLKDLLERGAIRPKRRKKGTWAFAVDAEHDLGKAVRVPSTVRAVILSRLQRLSPRAVTLLAAGAILEQGITFERLCAISKMTEHMGLSALDELVSSRLLLEVERPGSFSEYNFANDMIRDVVLTEAGDARRRFFHKRTLAILEATKGSSTAMLAHHALAAGLTEAAFRHSLAAGKEALHIPAITAAIIHFEKARQLIGEAPWVGAELESRLRDLYIPLEQAYALGGWHKQALAARTELERLLPE